MNNYSGEGNRREFELTLSTKGHCFLCLNRTTSSSSSVITELQQQQQQQSERNRKENDFRNLCNHIQIDMERLVSENIKIPTLMERIRSSLKTARMKVTLCEKCSSATERFSRLFQELEIIKLEMDDCLRRISQGISEGEENSELMQSYQESMSVDINSLFLIGFMDELKKEIAQKCSRAQFSQNISQVSLTRVADSLIEQTRIRRRIPHSASPMNPVGFEEGEKEPEAEAGPSSSSSSNSNVNSEVTSSSITINTEKAVVNGEGCNVISSTDVMMTTTTSNQARGRKGKLQFKCKICFKSFPRAYDVRIHRNIFHKEEIVAPIPITETPCTSSIIGEPSESHLASSSSSPSGIAKQQQRRSLRTPKPKFNKNVTASPPPPASSPPRPPPSLEPTSGNTFRNSKNNLGGNTEQDDDLFSNIFMPVREFNGSSKKSGSSSSGGSNMVPGKFKCRFHSCIRLFPSRKLEYLHFLSAHKKRPSSSADTTNTKNLTSSSSSHHQQKSPPPPLMGEDSNSIWSKFILDPSTARFKCADPLCSKQFSSKLTAKYHYDAIHLKIRKKCGGCAREFSYVTHYYQHKKKCSGNEYDKTEEEPQPIPSNHIVSHSGKKISIAKRRRKQYDSSSTSNRKKPPKRAFNCGSCTRQFSSHQNRDDHLKAIHLKDPYICEQCNQYSCIYRGDLLLHYRSSCKGINRAAMPAIEIAPVTHLQQEADHNQETNERNTVINNSNHGESRAMENNDGNFSEEMMMIPINQIKLPPSEEVNVVEMEEDQQHSFNFHL